MLLRKSMLDPKFCEWKRSLKWLEANSKNYTKENIIRILKPNNQDMNPPVTMRPVSDEFTLLIKNFHHNNSNNHNNTSNNNNNHSVPRNNTPSRVVRASTSPWN